MLGGAVEGSRLALVDGGLIAETIPPHDLDAAAQRMEGKIAPGVLPLDPPVDENQAGRRSRRDRGGDLKP